MSSPKNQNKPYRIEWGEKLSFKEDGYVFDQYLLEGWSGQEPNHRWTDKERAKLQIYLPEIATDTITLRVECSGYLANGKLEYQAVDVLVNKNKVASWKVRQKDWHEAIIPSRMIKNNILNVTFLIGNSISPFDAQLSSDKRKLGIALQGLEVVGASNLAQAIPERVTGSFKRMEGIFGWITSQTSPNKKLEVELIADGKSVARALADNYQPDLYASGLGDGKHGFAFAIPEALLDGKEHAIEVREVTSGFVLHGYPRIFPELGRSRAIGKLAFLADKTDRIEDFKFLNKSLDSLLSETGEPDCEPHLVESANLLLPPIAIKTGHLAAMRALSLRLIGHLDNPQHLSNLSRMMFMLHRWDPDYLDALLEKAGAAGLCDPLIAQIRGERTWAFQKGASPKELISLFSSLSSDAPNYDTAIRWLATVLFFSGDHAASSHYFALIAERGVIKDPLDASRKAHAALKISDDSTNETVSVPATHRLDLGGLPDLAPFLADIALLVNAELCHDSHPDPEEIASLGSASWNELSNFLENWDKLDISQCNQAAWRLRSAADGYIKQISIFTVTTPIKLTQAYGTLDPQRFALVHDALMQHVELLATRSLFHESTWQAVKNIDVLFDLAQHLTRSMLELQRPAEALVRLHQLRLHFDSVGKPLFEHLIEQCLLSSETRAMPEPSPGYRITPSVLYEMQLYPEWVAQESLRPVILGSDPVLQGSFDYVRSDGRVLSSEHSVPAQNIEVVAIKYLQVRASFLVIGPHGTILKAHPGHLLMGRYPYPDPIVLNHGHYATILKFPAATILMKEPVLVLGNMDVLRHNNYYHWMLLILTRIQMVNARGLLKNRKLLLPEELTGWMKASIEALGIHKNQIRTYRRDENLLLEDALFVSPIDNVTHSPVGALRKALFESAGVNLSLSGQSGRYLYISRKNLLRRALVNEKRATEIALQCGFEIVVPEELSLLDQVRLFASAQGIAGLCGAAFTNLIFAREGIRVLSISNEVESHSTFVDVSLQLNQQHRWLLGRTDERFLSDLPTHCPYHINEDLLERELLWVKAGAANLP